MRRLDDALLPLKPYKLLIQNLILPKQTNYKRALAGGYGAWLMREAAACAGVRSGSRNSAPGSGRRRSHPSARNGASWSAYLQRSMNYL